MSENAPRELDRRVSAGVRVSLWWSPAERRTWINVSDVSTGSSFSLPVRAGERARDVFDHPYAYAARRGIPTTARAVVA